jgi:hypothetical protein
MGAPPPETIVCDDLRWFCLELLTSVLRILTDWRVSELYYDRRSVGQSVLDKAPIWGLLPDFYYCQIIAGMLMSGVLSNERSSLSFTMYNVQYICILHVILRYSFTNLI